MENVEITIVRVLADQRPPTVPLTSVHSSLQPPGTDHLGQDGLAGVGVQLGAVSVGHDGNLGRP